METIIKNRKKWYRARDVKPHNYLIVRKSQGRLGTEGIDWIKVGNGLFVSEAIMRKYTQNEKTN